MCGNLSIYCKWVGVINQERFHIMALVKKILVGAGSAVVVAGTFVGGYAVGHENTPEESPRPSDTFKEAFSRTNDQCAAKVLEAAGMQFTYIGNNGSTSADEEYNTKTKAQADGDAYVVSEMEACMKSELPAGLSGYEVQMPVFKPEIKEGN